MVIPWARKCRSLCLLHTGLFLGVSLFSSYRLWRILIKIIILKLSKIILLKYGAIKRTRRRGTRRRIKTIEEKGEEEAKLGEKEGKIIRRKGIKIILYFMTCMGYIFTVSF
jgi:hypothetical protein